MARATVFRCILASLGCSLLFSAPLISEALISEEHSAAPVVLKMGVHNFPPDIVVHADGSCGGPGLELSRSIFEAAGMQVEPVCIIPARMFKLLDSGDIDFSINIKSTRKLSRAHVAVAPPYSKLQLVLYSHLDSSSAPRDDSVAAIRAFDYQGQRQLLSQQGYLFVDLPDSVSASQFFLHQRSQHLLTYDGPFRAYLLAQQPDQLKTLQRKPITSIDTFYILSAQSPHQAAMQQAIRQFAKKHHCEYLAQCRRKP
jgi:polar amino acid transport system substrate-binding protein